MTAPRWRQAYDNVERSVTPRVESLLHSGAFATFSGLLNQARRKIEADLADASRRNLHLLNLPAGSDVTRLLNEIGQLRHEINDLKGSERNGGGRRGTNASVS